MLEKNTNVCFTYGARNTTETLLSHCRSGCRKSCI